jgi:endonuclease/exonuclease/phosphatase family metal-dependent hydrolase
VRSSHYLAHDDVPEATDDDEISIRTIEGNVPVLRLDHFFTRTSYARNPIILYLYCMVTKRSDYLTRAFDSTHVKVLH